VVAALQASGRACHMLTGDNWTTARIIAARLGIRHVTAEVNAVALPSANRMLVSGLGFRV